MTTNFFDKICRDLILDHQDGRHITWGLLRRASFFLLVNVTSPYFFGVNDFLTHIANDGLMQVLWSWKEIKKLDREKTSPDGILELQYMDDWILASRKSLMLVDELKLIVEYNAICGFLDKKGKDNLMLDNSYEAFGKHARAICLLWYHQALKDANGYIDVAIADVGAFGGMVFNKGWKTKVHVIGNGSVSANPLKGRKWTAVSMEDRPPSKPPPQFQQMSLGDKTLSRGE
ncbi:hypothetical protein C2S52_004576 [Perilla frutescens var. hirtella]|nr:hypothetical protein C2S51_011021 [Perilla frutescens var. frutescens]KAH6794099.1 hypothetical protein C2S52_004576 [Perilla frutescens var. hirtella]